MGNKSIHNSVELIESYGGFIYLNPRIKLNPHRKIQLQQNSNICSSSCSSFSAKEKEEVIFTSNKQAPRKIHTTIIIKYQLNNSFNIILL